MKSWYYFDLKYIVNEVKPIFSPKYLRDDIFAGINVACVAIPISLAIALASHVDLWVGLISLVIGGFLAALFGGTTLAITGPTAAMAVLAADCVQNFGFSGLLLVGLICGVLQLISGFLSFGRFLRLVPLPVISAFTAGIGFIILVRQLPHILQLPYPSHNHVFYVMQHVISYIESMSSTSLLLALVTLVMLKVLPRCFPKLPVPLIAVAIPTIFVYFMHITTVNLVGVIPHGLPKPHLPYVVTINNWPSLLLTAIEVFILASLETFLASSAVDNMNNGAFHNSNQELIGQGVANIGVSMFGGMVVTGTIARSMMNIISGAKTRRSPIFQSLFVLGVIYWFPKLIEVIPISVIAAVLLSAALSMLNPRELIAFIKTDKSEAVIYIFTFLSIVVIDLASGIKYGILFACLIIGFRMLKTKSKSQIIISGQVLRINFIGTMVFWSSERVHKLQQYISGNDKLRVVLFDFTELSGLDSTGASHLLYLSKVINNLGITVLFNNINKKQQSIFNLASRDKEGAYLSVNGESEIQEVIEKLGINASNDDMITHSMEKFLDKYNQITF